MTTKPRVLIVVEGGSVVEVYSSVDIDWEVADYDALTQCDGMTADEATAHVMQLVAKVTDPSQNESDTSDE